MRVDFVEVDRDTHGDEVFSADARAGPIERFEHGRCGELRIGVASDRQQSFLQRTHSNLIEFFMSKKHDSRRF